eukprot:gene15148-20405_t
MNILDIFYISCILLLICNNCFATTKQVAQSKNKSKYSIVNTKSKTSSKAKVSESKTEKIHNLLPKLLPHKDTSYLISFHADNADYCQQMEPILQRLENDLNTKVRRINVNDREDFMMLFELVGGLEGNNFPFYYNRRTSQAICGPTSYINLRRLGTGNRRHLFNSPPPPAMPNQEEEINKRDVGLSGFLKERLLTRRKKESSKSAK